MASVLVEMLQKMVLTALQLVIKGVCRLGDLLPDLHKNRIFLWLVKKSFDLVCLIVAICCPPILVCLLIDPILSVCEKLNVGGLVNGIGNVICAVIKPFDSALDYFAGDGQIKKSLAYWDDYTKKMAAEAAR